MHLERTSGILLHPTSLPGPYGVGDIGPAAQRFIEFLAETAQSVWQVLPLCPPGFGNSPYLACSALAGNPLLISPDRLLADGLLAKADLAALPTFPTDRVDFGKAIELKFKLLRRAFANFEHNGGPESAEFKAFCQSHAHWLDDYALFVSIKEACGEICWHQWEPGIARRDPAAMAAWRDRLGSDLLYRKFMQFEFARQWADLKHYANERGIRIFGDIPIYVAHDSMEVWANPDRFYLDPETLEPSLMAGVPPDYFSETGQLWGNPIYRWERMREQGFEWWVDRFARAYETFDIVRLDHFRGFEAYWAVPQGETTAINGTWEPGPGYDLFQTVADRLGKLEVVAEDLGSITPEVLQLRDHFAFPGMKILQFAFDSGDGNPYLPHNYHDNPNCLVYTGTHDNDTTVGWFNSIEPSLKDAVHHYLGGIAPEGIHWSLIRYAWNSPANLAIAPLQDLLGLDARARMNAPGCGECNWEWRFQMEELTPEIRERLRDYTEQSNRVRT